MKCIACGIETYEEEYNDPKDADICGYCFADRLNEIRHQDGRVLLHNPQSRLDCILAECEIRTEASDDTAESEAYERIIRIIEA